VSTSELALRQGLRDTRRALARWRREPGPVVRGWFAGALGFAIALLAAVLVISSLATPDPTPLFIPGVKVPVGFGDFLHVLERNSLVLALHALACVAGFIAGSSLPLQAAGMSGPRRWVHERARPVAFAWVVGVTCFSLVTQAYVLGNQGAQIADQLALSPATLMLTVAPHALVELVAVFLPLAAWTRASRQRRWDELLAATMATVAIAIPLLLVAAAWEVWIWPGLLVRASPLFG